MADVFVKRWYQDSSKPSTCDASDTCEFVWIEVSGLGSSNLCTSVRDIVSALCALQLSLVKNHIHIASEQFFSASLEGNLEMACGGLPDRQNLGSDMDCSFCRS